MNSTPSDSLHHTKDYNIEKHNITTIESPKIKDNSENIQHASRQHQKQNTNQYQSGHLRPILPLQNARHRMCV